MPSMIFSSAQFFLQSVTVLAPAVLRVRFSHDPKQTNPLSSVDALNPTNYSVAGTHLVNVVAANSVAGDPQSIDVYLNVPLKQGAWTLTANSSIQMGDGTSLGAPALLAFDANGVAPRELPTQGAKSDQSYEILRKHMPSALAGPNWEALLRAVAVGDQYNWDNAVAAFDQKFLASASGLYLDRKAADQGVSRPPNIGMPDDLFRQYALKISAEKVTERPLLDILEIFYGADAVRAFVLTEQQEPFVLSDGTSLKVVADSQERLEVVFREQDFGRIGYCSAAEIAFAITRQARAARLKFFAVAEDKRVKIYSGSRGLSSSVMIAGGLAQNKMRFPAASTVQIANGVSFNITVSGQVNGIRRVRYQIQNSDGQHFLALRPGNYVNLSCSAFSENNRGSFPVVDAGTVYNGSDFFHFFEIENDAGTQQLGVATLSTQDVLFFDPTVARTYKGTGRSVSLAQSANGLSITIPATTQAVGRQEKTGSYLHDNGPVSITQVQNLANSTMKVTTTTPHGVVVGRHVEIEGAVADTAPPAVLAGVAGSIGSPGISPACHATAALSLRPPDGVVGGRYLSAQARLATGDLLVVGGANSVAPQNDSIRFRLGAETILGAGVAEGRAAYSYEWIASASAPSAAIGHSLSALTGSLSPNALLLGGTADGTTASATASLYNPTLNSWTAVPNGTLAARYNHTATRLLNASAEEIVLIVGGQADATTAVAMTQVFSGDAGGTLSNLVAETVGRFRHRALAVTPEKMLVIGGAKFAPTVEPRDDCWMYNAATSLYSNIGKLAIARMDFGVTQVATNAVLVVGGYGRSLSNETTDRVLSSCEILDLATGQWGPTGHLRFARRNPQVAVMAGKIYAIGGLGADGNVVSQTEVWDPKTGRWAVCPNTAATSSYCPISVIDDKALLVGEYTPGVVTAGAKLFVPGAEKIGGSLNGTYKVGTVYDSTTLYLESPHTGYSAAFGGALIPLSAQSNQIAGPFVWDPDQGNAVTGIEATLSTPLFAGQQYRTLTVGSGQANAFPEQDGWLVIGLGTKHEVSAVPYLGKFSGDTLSIDYSFVVPHDVPAGTQICLLMGKGPYSGTDAASVGSLYATASSAGRVAAQSAVESAVAAGLQVDIDVSYPGDKGLARAGYPKEGIRISEKVHVWGGDDLDGEIATARGS